MFFRKKKSLPTQIPFTSRVDTFWQWFQNNSQRLLDGIDSQQFEPLVPEVAEQVKKMARLAWVFGPPPQGQSGHSFTLTPEGCKYRQHLIEFCLSRAPRFDMWTFYQSKQPSKSVDGISIDVMGEKLTATEFWVIATPDPERHKVDLKLWHPLFAKVEEKDQHHITFIWLDECLGEFVVENQIGSIDISPDGLEESFPINELKEVFYKLWNEHGWETPNPTHIYTSYSIKEEALKPEKIRGDIFTGSTCLFALIDDFIQNDGKMDHPTPEIGVDYLFLALPINNFTHGEQVNERSEIEDALQARLESDGSGKTVGGASGTKFMYLDIMSFDIEKTLLHIQQIASQFPTAKNAELRFFDKARIDGQIPL